MLVSTKLQLEAALIRLDRSGRAYARDVGTDGATDVSADVVPDVASDIASDVAAGATSDPVTDAVLQPVQNALAQTNRTLGEIRRISHDLRPTMLDDLGLGAALRQLARESGSGVQISVDAPTGYGQCTLPDAVNTALFRVAQEALTNIACHAQARHASLKLTVWARQVVLTITDDGRGFDRSAVQADPSRGIGLRNMRERIESLEGSFQIQSRPGHTELIAVIPLPAATLEPAQPVTAGSTL